MAKYSRKVGATSQIFQIFIADSSSTTGAGLTGLTNASSGLTAYFHRDTDTTATAISLVTMTVGTFTSSGFKEIDATNMPGWYQLCPPNTSLASGAANVGIHLKGATNMAPCPLEIDLDAQVDVTFWNGTVVATPATAGIPDINVKNMNNVAATSVTTINANQGTTQPVNFSGTGGSAFVKSDMEQINAQTASASGTVTFPNATLASTTNITAGTITTVTTVTNQLTAAAIATGIWADTTAGDFTAAASIGKSILNGVALGTGLTINGYTGNTVQTGDSYARIGSTGSGLTSLAPAATALSTATWTGTLATNLGTLASHDPGTTIGTSTLTQTQVTGGAYNIQSSSCILGDARIADLDASISSRMATYTQPAGFLAATFPSGTIANTTNITAGTITTVTNLTNAPTAGDFTSTMKTSITTAATAATPTVLLTAGTSTGQVVISSGILTANTNGDFTTTQKTSIGTAVAASAVASVTGNVGGNVVGSVGSVTSAVGITSNRKKGSTATFEFLMQDATTGAPKTGLTVASTISKDGGSSSSTANSVTEIGLGQYQIVLTGTEMTANNIFLQFIATGAIIANLFIQTQP